MPSASKTTTTKTTAKTAATPKPEAKVERVAGEIYASENGQILRQSENGIQLLFSPVPTTNIHPNHYSAEEYEAKVLETYGPLTKIYPVK